MKIRLCALALLGAFPAIQAVQAADAKLGEVVVTATRQAQRVDEALTSVDVIDRARIERSGHSTLTELLAAQPGLQVTSNGGPGASTGVFIRGAASGHTLVLVNGMRIGSVTSGAATLEAIPAELIERIEIVRGPASALYGSDAIGGVIQIFTRKGGAGFQPSVYAGVGSQHSFKLGAGVAGGDNGLRYNLAAGRERTRGFNARRTVNTAADRDRDGFHNDYFNAAASLDLGADNEIGFALLHTDGRNWYDADTDYNARFDKGVSNANVHWRSQFSPGWVSTLRAGYSEDRARSRSLPAPVGKDRFDSKQTQFAWQNDIELGAGALLFAVEHLEQRIETSGDYVRSRRRSNSALLGWNGQFDQHRLQVNVRHDDDSQFGDKSTGLLAYGYQFSPAWLVRASIGTAFKAPTFNDLYFPTFCSPEWGCFGGNPSLKPEESLNRELGLVWEPGGMRLSATYFNNRVKNLVQWLNTPENIGKAKLEGVELAVSTELAGYRLSASADFLNAKDQRSGERLVRRAKRSGALSIERSVAKWGWGAEWRGQSIREDAASRLGGYGLVNAWIHHQLSPELRLELRANNLFDKRYELANNFATAGSNAFLMLRYQPR